MNCGTCRKEIGTKEETSYQVMRGAGYLGPAVVIGHYCGECLSNGVSEVDIKALVEKFIVSISSEGGESLKDLVEVMVSAADYILTPQEMTVENLGSIWDRFVTVSYDNFIESAKAIVEQLEKD